MTTISETSNKELMAQARTSLSGTWGLAVGTMLIYTVILVGIQFIPVAGWLISLIISGPLVTGLAIFTLALARKKNPQLSQLFDGFQNFGVSMGAYLLMALLVFLWSLLLIIPGIIAALSYSMTFFIIAEDNKIGPMEAITKSKTLMNGNKGKYFCLAWRFFGWMLLCCLTGGIGFLWLMPYMAVSQAKFYEDITKRSKKPNSK